MDSKRLGSGAEHVFRSIDWYILLLCGADSAGRHLKRSGGAQGGIGGGGGLGVIRNAEERFGAPRGAP